MNASEKSMKLVSLLIEMKGKNQNTG